MEGSVQYYSYTKLQKNQKCDEICRGVMRKELQNNNAKVNITIDQQRNIQVKQTYTAEKEITETRGK